MKQILNNIELIIVIAVIALRAIIALPLTFAAVHHFQFLDVEATWIVYLVAYVSIFAVEAIMTIFSFISASFRKANLNVAYYTSFAFVLLFFALNAFLLWEIKNVYQNVTLVSILVWQILNLASVALAESIGFMNTEKVTNSVTMRELKGDIPEDLIRIRDNDNIPTDEKVRQLHLRGYFSTQSALAEFVGISQSRVSACLKTK